MRNANKRMRGRNRGKGPNPLSRSYESNGPDVKIRGTAQHIAEKYLQLARDAHTSGDPVAAENYLQHAEHYFRLIAAAQEAQRLQMGLPRADGQPEEETDEDDDDDFVSPFDKRFESPVVARQEQQPQPRMDFGGQQQLGGYQGGGQQREGQGGYQGERRDFRDRGEFRDRDRNQGGGWRDRNDRSDRGGYQDRPRFQQPDQQPQGDQPDVAGATGEGGEPRVGPDGRPFESRRERFERRRHERFLERQARREAGGEVAPAGEGEGGERRDFASETRRDFRRDEFRRDDYRRDERGPAPEPAAEPVSLGLPAFITGGGASAPAPVPAPSPEAAVDEPIRAPRRRRTPRHSDETPAAE